MAGKHRVIRFYSKMDDVGKEKTVIATVNNPNIIAKNWYQVNTNKRLKAIIEITGRLEDFEDFDTVQVYRDRSYSVFEIAPKGMNRLRMEVGV